MKRIYKLITILFICLLLYGCTQSAEEQSQIDEETTCETDITTEPESVPEELPTEEDVSQEPALTAKVPKELQDLLTDSFLAGTTAETLKAIVNDAIVPKDEYALYRSCGIDEDLDYLEEQGGILLKVDADNDGTDDLFLWIDDGGSSGNSSFYLAKGYADGSYEVTETHGTVSQEIAFIVYADKNYLVETDFEYNRKALNGFTVTCYEQGKISDSVVLEAVVNTWDTEIISCESKYQTLADEYAVLGKDGFHDTSNYDYRVNPGSAERIEIDQKTTYYSDINNDGSEEWYSKSIFYPSNIGTTVSLDNKLYFTDDPDAAQYLPSYYNLQYDGTPLNFWVEQNTDETGTTKQIVCLLSYEGLNRNHIYGYLIEGESVTKVFEIEYIGQLTFAL